MSTRSHSRAPESGPGGSSSRDRKPGGLRGDLSGWRDTSGQDRKRKRTRRVANVYDAVAGRVKTTEPLTPARPPSSGPDEPRNLYSLRDQHLAPDEVLFRRERAPPRFAEKDIYWANEDLPDGGCGVLPDADLLKSVHAYASRFYEAMGQRQPASAVGRRLIDERSMDETALLAVGVLLEEAARDSLGRKGDIVFTEGIVDVRAARRGGGTGDGDGDGDDGDENITTGFMSGGDCWKRKYPKRRKVDNHTVGDDDDEVSMKGQH